MKLTSPSKTIEVVSNLAWVNCKRAVISLYSLRYLGNDPAHGVDFKQVIDIAETINKNWTIEEWCFDWSAERDLTLFFNGKSTSIFDVLHLLLVELKAVLPSHQRYVFMHGDANLAHLHEAWRKKTGLNGFDRIVHYNRFFYHYNLCYPSAKPEIMVRGAYTTFNRKYTTYRKKLLDYLKNNQLLDQGYVNFQFEDVSNLVEPLISEYEDGQLASENQIYRYYRATNFDIIIETATQADENQQFLTEKTLRALALGQPFVTYNGTGSLQYLRELGFRTYQSMWDESYDNIQDNDERFGTVMYQVKQLINNRAIFEQPLIKEINEHNKFHFQKLARLNHRERWFRS